MNPTTGNNSNTSGASVANVLSFPKTILTRIVTELGNLKDTIQSVADGSAKPALVDFMEKGGSDCISDSVMEEIRRRLVVTFEDTTQGNIVYSPTPPTDHTKAWIQTDVVSGIPIGGVKRWDDTTSQWVLFNPESAYTPPARRFMRVNAAAGSSIINVPFEDIQTDDYMVILTPTTFDGSAWASAPGSFPSAYGYVVVNKTSNAVSISFQAIPTDGLYFEVDIVDRQTTA